MIKHPVRAYAATVLFALSLAASAAAQTAFPNIAIDNFGRVNANYYRGSQPKGHDYADLAAMGIKTVIDLQKDFDVSEQQAVENAGMKFYRIPMTTSDRPAPEAVAQFLKFVNDPANQPVYVHCEGGHHRTGAMTAAYRMTQEGWTADRAFSEMKQYKFGADFLHPALKSFVYAYYDQIGRSQRRVTGERTRGN